MQAVKLPNNGIMLFSAVPIPDTIKAELLDDLGGEILDNVTLEERPDLSGAPPGEGKIETMLWTSRSDPGHFVVIPHRNQAEALDFDPAAPIYNVIKSEKGWRIFLSTLKMLTEIASHTDETDDDEGWAETMSHLVRPD